MIFSEGKYQPKGSTQFPVRLIPSLWGATDDVRKRVSSELLSMAAISLPAVVVEDTHPTPIQLPARDSSGAAGPAHFVRVSGPLERALGHLFGLSALRLAGFAHLALR